MHRRLGISIQYEKSILEWIRFAWLLGDILSPKDRRPINNLVVVLLVNSSQDIRSREESSVGKCLEDGVCGEEVIRVVVGDKDSFEGLLSCLEFLFDPGYCIVGVGDEEWRIKEDGFFRADYEGCHA